MPSLIPLAGEPRTFEVGARAIVGRDPTCEVCVEDPSVSRRHAEIRLLEDGRYEVVDLASKHGVVVRGEKVQKAVLAHGDELQIGLARFRSQSQDPALGSTELRISVADVPGFPPAALIAAEPELRRDYDHLRAGIGLRRPIGAEHRLPTPSGRILYAANPLRPADRGPLHGVRLLDAEGRLVMVNQRAEARLPVLTNTRQGDLLPRLGDVALPLKGTVEVTAGRRIFALSQVALDSQTLITLREVTEEREEQARAEQQERLALIGQFAGGIAHDFNNVIAVITTNAEFLEESIQDPDQREDARQIREAAERAADLTRRVLSFGRREPCQPRPLALRKQVLA